ncbi:hypothetical protein SAMN05421788_1122 [Filimonas lacunae]|uniref:DUF3300 domain-containing protein n=1 Tax=Filimonas lacunae TaxID=477680 RepID=A0A173MLB5_9BACT|nr:hypothetical protein [Filimonas lacunae]BAV08198.1 hypothetical protein FLA_4231 [Filimonas lacunae]SIT33008.1 hypothetical protein SAMN05421788_1122 [Filimonas lacunae]
MKKLMTLLIAATVFTVTANAQVSVSINIGTQPVWGPTGYDHVDYYYLPDADVYYYVPEKVYIYQNGNTWRRSSSLPARYKNIDLYQAHKVVINNVDKPYLNHAQYQKQYASFKGKHDQTPIRDSKEEKYFENRKHPQHSQWVKDHPDQGKGNNGKGNNGKGNNGNGKGNGRH